MKTENGTWIGKDLDGEKLYPIDEINKYWRSSYTGPDDKFGTRTGK